MNSLTESCNKETAVRGETTKNRLSGTAVPYGDLSIYYLEGIPGRDSHMGLGENFLGCWEEDGYAFLFFRKPAPELVGGLLKDEPGLALLDTFCIPYETWQGQVPVPFEVGPFFIRPPWDRAECPKGKIEILCDPGVVFGTGTHPTTRDCLLALQNCFGEAPPEKVLDLGCGTGILSLASAALGAREVLAIDLNPLCATTTRKNVELNGFSDCIRVVTGSALDYTEEPASLVIANIHFAVMKELLQNPSFLSGRRFLLSGLMRSEARWVMDFLAAKMF